MAPCGTQLLVNIALLSHLYVRVYNEQTSNVASTIAEQSIGMANFIWQLSKCVVQCDRPSWMSSCVANDKLLCKLLVVLWCYSYLARAKGHHTRVYHAKAAVVAHAACKLHLPW